MVRTDSGADSAIKEDGVLVEHAVSDVRTGGSPVEVREGRAEGLAPSWEEGGEVLIRAVVLHARAAADSKAFGPHEHLAVRVLEVNGAAPPEGQRVSEIRLALDSPHASVVDHEVWRKCTRAAARDLVRLETDQKVARAGPTSKLTGEVLGALSKDSLVRFANAHGLSLPRGGPNAAKARIANELAKQLA